MQKKEQPPTITNAAKFFYPLCAVMLAILVSGGSTLLALGVNTISRKAFLVYYLGGALLTLLFIMLLVWLFTLRSRKEVELAARLSRVFVDALEKSKLNPKT